MLISHFNMDSQLILGQKLSHFGARASKTGFEAFMQDFVPGQELGTKVSWNHPVLVLYLGIEKLPDFWGFKIFVL